METKPLWGSMISNFHGMPGVPVIVQSARVLTIGEILHIEVDGGTQPFAVLRIATREEWIAAIRQLGFDDQPRPHAICFAEVVTD